jgi:8-oxo-dGTP diphosphatase
VIFGYDGGDLKVLLIQRGLPPFKGRWALPGGFVHMDESVDQAARRELQEETGVKNVFLEQLYTFGATGRDPRGRVVTVAYYALVKLSDQKVRAATDAREADWFPVWDVPDLAFDHAEILRVAHERLRGKVRYDPIGFELLPEKFTLTDLQSLYETILERKLDKRNFRKKVAKLDILLDLKEVQQDVAHRAARLFGFEKSNYLKRKSEGFHFEL